MKKINRHNYEVFFVDYFDNELAEYEIKELFTFLDANPDLKLEFDSFENINIPSSINALENKNILKKHIDKKNIEHYIIADLEKELDKNDKQEYTNFVAENSFYSPLIERYKRTILPKEKFNFPNKSELKQKNKVIVLWPYYAASIVAVVLLFFVLNTNSKSQQYQFQALKNVQKLKVDSVKNIDAPFQELKEIQLEANKSIAKNNIKKKIEKKYVKKNLIPTMNTIDSTSTIPKEIKQTKTPQKETFPGIQEQESTQLYNHITLVENNDVIREEKAKSTLESIPTLKQTIHNKVKAKIFNDENKENKLINGEYLITATTEKMKNVSFKKTDEKNRKKIRLKIGKFEFYRDKGV